nr:glycoprotein [Drosophila busckii rhabdovirus]
MEVIIKLSILTALLTMTGPAGATNINGTDTPSYLTPPGSPELRLKLITERTPVSLVELETQSDCFPYEESLNPHSHVIKSSVATVYYPMREDTPLYGLSITLESREYVCDDPWLGINTIKLLGRSRVPIAHANKEWLEKFVDKVQATSWATDRYWFGYSEGETKTEVDCNYASTTYKTQLYLVVERVRVVTSMNWKLIQPVKVDTCVVGVNASCDLSPTSRIFFSTGYLPHGCRLSVLSRIAGVLSMDRNDLSLLRFHSESSDFALTLKRENPTRPFSSECEDKGTYIYSSTEGHLVSFSSSQGVADLEALLEQLKPSHLRSKKEAIFINPNFPLIETHPPYRMKSLKNRVEMRVRRDHNTNYPEFQRLDYLENKLAWGLSTFEYYTDQLSVISARELLRTRYNQCLIKNSMMEIAVSLNNPTIYVRMKLDDPGFLVISKDGNIIRILAGVPISAIRIPNQPYNWCNGSLGIEYEDTDTHHWVRGWLRHGTGLILASTFSGNTCLQTRPPSTFQIPSYDQGMWDLFKENYVSLLTNQITRKEFQYTIMNLPVDSSASAWEFHEKGIEFFRNYEPEDTWENLKRLIGGASFSHLEWVPQTMKFISMIIVFLISLKVISFLWWILPSRSGRQSYSRGKLLQ